MPSVPRASQSGARLSKRYNRRINRNTIDSINYAARIQSAVYQDIEILRKSTADAFVLLLTKDIVGGDFGGSRIAVMIFGLASQIAQAMESRAHL